MPDRPRVVVVGLGPAGPELIDGATRAALDTVEHRYLRTRVHPAAAILPDVPSFDHVYEEAPTLEAVYREIVEQLVGAAQEHGAVLYAVPGSPFVAERTVELLRDDDRVDADVRPAMSFLELVWARLGVDPVASGVRVVDGRRFPVEAAGERGPLLVAQCDSALVLSDVKLAIDANVDGTPADLVLTVLQRLGTDDERVEPVPWSELDRAVQPDHLTSVWIPELAAPVAREVERFAELVATLRRECPWDRAQTHQSLERHVIEETYELVDAIEHLDPDVPSSYEHLEEELGDLLFQVVFHATLAAEAGQFTLADVARHVHDKLYQRHPHVFADVAVDGADDVVRNWEQIKKEEKGRTSVFEGIPSSLPALLLALKAQKKAQSLRDAGIDIPSPPPVDELVARARARPDAEAIGALVFAVVDLARRSDVDPEAALRGHVARFRDAAKRAEQAG